MSRRENLTDDQWALIKPLIPLVPAREDGKGRPRIHSDREVLKYTSGKLKNKIF